MAKTLSVGVLQPRKFAAAGQKAFRTHKGFDIDSGLEEQLIKIRHEMEGEPQAKKPTQKLNQLGRLPQPGWNKDSNRSVSDTVDEANKTGVGFEVVFVNPRASQEYGINANDQVYVPRKEQINQVIRREPSNTRSTQKQGLSTVQATSEMTSVQMSKKDGFGIELSALEACIVKIVWEDFIPIIDKDDDESSEEQDHHKDVKIEASQAKIEKRDTPRTDIHDKNETLQTASTAAASGEQIFEDLISLKAGQTIKKEYSFETLNAFSRKGVRFVISLLCEDGASITSRYFLTKALEKLRTRYLKTRTF